MITITLDATQLNTYLKCPQKWYLGHQEHLQLADANRLALDKGTIFHKLLEIYYHERFTKTYFDAADAAIGIFYASATKELELVDKDTLDFLLNRFNQYILNYQQNDFSPLRLENVPSIELGFSHEFYRDAEKQFILEGKIDLISKSGADLVFVDHKTQGRASFLYQYSPQFLTYAMVTGIHKAVQNIIGFQKDVTKDTFKRVPITFAPHQINAWKNTVFNVFERIYNTMTHVAVPDFEKNYAECGGPFNSFPCQFTHICELNPENKELINNIKSFKYTKRVWSPWEIETM